MSIETNSSSGASGHALVVGGSIAGLLAARVLADRYERVTIQNPRLALHNNPSNASCLQEVARSLCRP